MAVLPGGLSEPGIRASLRKVTFPARSIHAIHGCFRQETNVAATSGLWCFGFPPYLRNDSVENKASFTAE